MESILNEIMKLLPLAATYIVKLGVPTLIGEEVIKESTKKFYSFIFDKFKKQNKEEDLVDFTRNPENEKLEGKVESVLETILKNEEDRKTLLTLLTKAKAEIKIVNTQENEEGNNEIMQDFSKSKEGLDVHNEQRNKSGENSINQTF